VVQLRMFIREDVAYRGGHTGANRSSITFWRWTCDQEVVHLSLDRHSAQRL